MALQETDQRVLNGAKLLKSCDFDHRLCAALIALQDNWHPLLESIGEGPLRRSVARFVWEFREASGKDCDYAKAVCQGREVTVSK